MISDNNSISDYDLMRLLDVLKIDIDETGVIKIPSKTQIEAELAWCAKRGENKNSPLLWAIIIRFLLLTGYITPAIFGYFSSASIPAAMFWVHWGIIIVTALAAIVELIHMIKELIARRDRQNLNSSSNVGLVSRFLNYFHLLIDFAKVILFSLACYFAAFGNPLTVFVCLLAVEILNVLSGFIDLAQERGSWKSIPFFSIMAAFFFTASLSCIVSNPAIIQFTLSLPHIFFLIGIMVSILPRIMQGNKVNTTKSLITNKNNWNWIGGKNLQYSEENDIWKEKGHVPASEYSHVL